MGSSPCSKSSAKVLSPITQTFLSFSISELLINLPPSKIFAVAILIYSGNSAYLA